MKILIIIATILFCTILGFAGIALEKIGKYQQNNDKV